MDKNTSTSLQGKRERENMHVRSDEKFKCRLEIEWCQELKDKAG